MKKQACKTTLDYAASDTYKHVFAYVDKSYCKKLH